MWKFARERREAEWEGRGSVEWPREREKRARVKGGAERRRRRGEGMAGGGLSEERACSLGKGKEERRAWSGCV